MEDCYAILKKSNTCDQTNYTIDMFQNFRTVLHPIRNFYKLWQQCPPILVL